MSRQLLKLYVTGRTRRAQEAVRNMRALVEAYGSETFDLVVVDVLENPEQAEADKILATPTLLQSGPYGTARIVGEFSESARVRQLLGLSAGPAETGTAPETDRSAGAEAAAEADANQTKPKNVDSAEGQDGEQK